MTTVTVSVDATSRISRFEFSTPQASNGMVYGYSEVLLQEPAAPSGDTRMPGAPAPKEGEKVTYGVMPGPSINRGISIVMEETVDVDGTTISFNTVLKAMGAFFEKWRAEDAEIQPPEPSTMMAPAAITPPPMPDRPAEMDVNPPPELSRPRE
jgi:hypothetical protein